MIRIFKCLRNIIITVTFGMFFLSCSGAAKPKENIEYLKWPDELIPSFNESINSNIGMFYYDWGNGIESSLIFSTPNNNGPSIVLYLTTSKSLPSTNYSFKFELVSINDSGGIIMGKCISSSGMFKNLYLNGLLYTICDSYKLIDNEIGAELTLTGGILGSSFKYNLINPK